MGALVLVTPPAAEPVTLAEARAHVRIDGNDEDGMLAGYVLAARQHVEDYTGRALISRAYDVKLDWSWPRSGGTPRITLPRPPLVSVTSVSYVDTNGANQTLATNQYQVSTGETFGAIVPAFGVSWPTVRRQLDAATVRFVAGYGTLASDVPEPIRHAVLLLVAHFYQNREAVNVGNIVTPMQLAVEALLSPYRVNLL